MINIKVTVQGAVLPGEILSAMRDGLKEQKGRSRWQLEGQAVDANGDVISRVSYRNDP